MKSRAIIILLLVVVFSGWLVAGAFAQSTSVQGPAPLVWHGIDVSQTLQNAANGAVVIGVPIAIGLAVAALIQIVESRRACQAEVTLRLFEHLESDQVLEAMDCLREPKLKSADDEMEFEKVRHDRKAEIYFHSLANFFELIGHLVQSRTYSPDLTEKTFGAMLRNYWKDFEPLVTGYRQLQKEPGLWKAWQRYVENTRRASVSNSSAGAWSQRFDRS